MDCRITSTSNSRRKKRRLFGFTLSEMSVAMGMTILFGGVVAEMCLFSSHCVTALYNYVDLDDANRIAIDRITRDVRQCNRVWAAGTNYLILETENHSWLMYYYSPISRTVSRISTNSYNIILRDCDQFGFSIGQRNTVGGSYDVYPAATPDTAKVVNVSWICSRKMYGVKSNTESVQTARIVIRKQGT